MLIVLQDFGYKQEEEEKKHRFDTNLSYVICLFRSVHVQSLSVLVLLLLFSVFLLWYEQEVTCMHCFACVCVCVYESETFFNDFLSIKTFGKIFHLQDQSVFLFFPIVA